MNCFYEKRWVVISFRQISANGGLLTCKVWFVAGNHSISDFKDRNAVANYVNPDDTTV